MERTLKIELANILPNGRHFYAKLNLPAAEYELRDAYHQLRLQGNYDIPLEVSILNSPLLRGLSERRLDSPTLNELNFFAKRLSALDEYDRLALRAMASKYFRLEEEDVKEDELLISMNGLINLTYDLNEVVVFPGIEDDMALGEFIIKNNLNDDIAAMPETSLYLLYPEWIGEQQRKREGGVFIDGDYFVPKPYEKKNIYTSKELPESEKITSYAFRLEIAPAPGNDLDMEATEPESKWISLPIEKSEADAAVKAQGAEKIEDCVYLGFESVIPQIDADQFGDMRKFDELNALAKEIMEMSFKEQAKFKAVLCAESPGKIGQILDIATHLKDYELNTSVESSGEFFEAYLKTHLPSSFDGSWLNNLSAENAGQRLLEVLGAKMTDYGVISSRGRSLYELVPMEKHAEVLDKRMEVIEIFGHTALFSNDRIAGKDVPEGLYKYELRDGDDGYFATVEKQVAVNHGGTVLTNKPLQLEKGEYQVFGEETYPNFLWDKITVREYVESQSETEDENQTIGEIK